MTESRRRAAPAPGADPAAELQLQMSVVDADGQVLATVDEPFAVGRFDLAAARQGMRKLLIALGAPADA